MPFSFKVDLDGEGVHNAFGDSVRVTVTDDSHGYIVVRLGSVPEVVDVIASGVSSRSSGRFSHDGDNLSSSLGNLGNKFSVKVFVVLDNGSESLSLNGGVVDIGVLSGRVVSPNVEVDNILNSGSSALSNLGDSSVLIESSQSGEVSLGDGRGVLGSDESVGVSGVSDNTDLASLLGNSIHSGSLGLEDLGVGLEEISSFHTGTSGSGTDHDDDISVLESDEGVGSGDDAVDAVISSVIKFHDESLEYLLGSREFQKLQDNLLVGSEHTSLSDEVAKESSDLSSGSSDGNSNRSRLEVLGDGGEVSTELLETAYNHSVIHFVQCKN